MAIWPSKGQLLYLLFVSYFAQTTWTNCTCWIYSYVWQPTFLFPGHLMSWLEAVRVFSQTKWRHFGTPLFGDYSVIIINYLEVRVQVVFSLYTVHFSFFLLNTIQHFVNSFFRLLPNPLDVIFITKHFIKKTHGYFIIFAVNFSLNIYRITKELFAEIQTIFHQIYPITNTIIANFKVE